MSKTLYTVINPVVKFILGSPFHGLMSRNTLLLEFKGRKSGKQYSMPVSYHASNGHVHCFTDKNNKWWHNLRYGGEVTLTLRGRKRIGKPSVQTEGSPESQTALRDFLVASPRDASHAGVAFDADGEPVSSDLAKANDALVFLSIEIGDEETAHS